MQKQSLKYLVFLCLAMLVAAVTVLAQDHSALVGKWKMVSETDSDPVNWTLVLTDTDGKLGGTLSSPDGESPAKNFLFDGGTIKFKAPYGDKEYDIELKLTGDKLDGTWSGNGTSGKTHGVKAS